jgi:thiamine pyrophosphate-dependent acetolactate synthase large subunit-like protein
MDALPRTAPELPRVDALRVVARVFPDQPVVLTLGGTVREMLAVCGRQPNHLYILDSMGLPVPIALGLAVGLENDPRVERVVVVEGDGSALMGFSVLSTVGLLKPRKLVVILLDNGVYLATGGQPTAASSTDFVAAARACGWAAESVASAHALEAALERASREPGPMLVHMRVGTAAPPTDYFLEDPVVLAEDFRRWLDTRASGPTANHSAGA